MKTIAFNMVGISDSNLVGSTKYIQRLLLEMLNRNLDFKYVFYFQEHIDVTLFGIDEGREDITVIRVPSMLSRWKRMLFFQTSFYKYLKPVDVFYSPDTYLPLFARGKKIITLHDLLPFSFKKKHSLARRLFIVSFTRVMAKIAEHILTVSEYSRNDIIKFLNVRKEKVSIIYNFIIPNEKVVRGHSMTNGTIGLKDRLIEIKSPYICTVSSLQPGKNLQGLIKGFSKFHEVYPTYHLYICGGKGWGYEMLYELVKVLNAEDFIHFTGYLKDEELDKLYTGCDAVAYVSFFEGFGIPPLEGFIHGKPCVASNVSSLPEVVGKAGVLINPYAPDSIAAGLCEIIENKSNYLQFIREQIKKFDPEIETDKFISLLQKI